MKHLLSLIIIAILGIVGCSNHVLHASYVASPLTTPVYIDDAFSDKQKEDILLSLKLWNDALNGQHTYEVKEMKVTPERLQQVMDTHYGLVIVKDNDEELIADGVLAYTNELRGNLIAVETDFIGDRDLVSIMMHEEGHQLGLMHLPIYGSLMSPSVQLKQPRCVDESSARELVTVRPRDFKLSLISYCVIPE